MPYLPPRARSVLLVSPQEQHVAALQVILADSPLILYHAQSVREALRLLTAERTPVVICECDLPDGNWKTLLEGLSEVAFPPRLIVSCRLADDHLWAEVLNLGGYDVLMTPFVEKEACRVISAACDSWLKEISGSVQQLAKSLHALC